MFERWQFASLKFRLIMFYLLIIGGIIFLFSIAVYTLSRVTLLQQVDETLEQTATDVLQITRISTNGDFEITRLLSLNDNVFVQAWDREGHQQAGTNNLTELTGSMDPLGLQSSEPIFRDVTFEDVHLRVLSVPLFLGGRTYGTLQVGTNMTLVDGALSDLYITFTFSSIVALIIAALAGWVTIQTVIDPLDSVTSAALEITEANDLSRRIPLYGSPNDELGQLVQAFNLNLNRLERLIETQRRFLADVGHELRTPLTVIKGNVAIMKRIGADQESLDSIEGETDRLTRLVGDLLLLAQAEAGKLPMQRELTELDTVMLDVFHTAKILAKEKCKLTISEIDQVLVCGAQDRLKQVMLNLISNGIKYTPKGGEVVISLRKERGEARLSIKDNGPGIPKEDLPHIFERFYRAEKSRQRSQDGKGFGLGLSIAYWIVRNHDGHIEVESQLGKGTEFIVWLPLAEGACDEVAD